MEKLKRKKFKWTLRERKFIAAYIENSGNAAKAYLAINPKAKHPRQYGYRMLQKVDISTNELLNEMGMTDAFLADVLQKGLSSTKTVGKLVPVTIDDYAIIHKYLDTAYKLKGTYPAEKYEETRRVIVLGRKEKKEDGKDEK